VEGDGMSRLIKFLIVAAVATAVTTLSPAAATAGALHMGDQAFANPDELGDCPLAEPAFSGNFRWWVYYTDDPSNPAAPYLTPGNTDTFTIVIEVSNDLLLDLPAECSGGPYSGDPNPGDLSVLNVGTYNLGYGDFLFPTVTDYGTIDDGDPATIAPSGAAFNYSAIEFYFNEPNIDAGETAQKVFFTVPSIEPGEVASFFLQAPSGATDDEAFVPLPLETVPVLNVSWGALKATYK